MLLVLILAMLPSPSMAGTPVDFSEMITRANTIDRQRVRAHCKWKEKAGGRVVVELSCCTWRCEDKKTFRSKEFFLAELKARHLAPRDLCAAINRVSDNGHSIHCPSETEFSLLDYWFHTRETAGNADCQLARQTEICRGLLNSSAEYKALDCALSPTKLRAEGNKCLVTETLGT